MWLERLLKQRKLLFSLGVLTLLLILGGKFLWPSSPVVPRASSYERSLQAEFNLPSHYPTSLSELPAFTQNWYRPVADWMGRLILPTVEEYMQDDGDWVWFEVQHAPQETLVGQVVKLTWQATPAIQSYVDAVTVDITFGATAARSRVQGDVVPSRLDGRQQVGPLQSLAGARPIDDVLVRLVGVEVDSDEGGAADTTEDVAPRFMATLPVLQIREAPVQVGGREVALVQLLETVPRSPVPEDCPGADPCSSESFRVRHYNPSTQQFDGLETVVRIPQQPRDRNGRFLSTPHELLQSPAGEAGWYLYGAFDREGVFTVQALQPRSLMRLQPDQVIQDFTDSLNFIDHQTWQDIQDRQGTLKRSLLSLASGSVAAAVEDWQMGDRGLVIHLFGGIGGELAEAGTPGSVTGHFAYGVAEVVEDTFTGEARFDITYHQIYAHNPNAIIAGVLDWSAYTGNLERGWLGSRPISDVIVKLDTFTEPFDLGSQSLSLFESLLQETQVIAARYRTGDGTGVATVSPATSCVQDSSQAFYIAIEAVKQKALNTPEISMWLDTHPDDPGAGKFWEFVNLGKDLVDLLAPYGVVRPDWKQNAEALAGVNSRNGFVSSRSLINTLLSWRSMMPRRAHDELSRTFLEHGAQLWFLRTNQVGGRNPEIAPLAPTLLFGKWPVIGTLTKRLGDAVSTTLTGRKWLITLGALLLYGAIALPYGFYTRFLQVSIAPMRSWLAPLRMIQLFIVPAMVEEGIFRVLLLPHPLEGIETNRWLLWALLSLTAFVLYHPLNARLFYPPGRGTFSDQRFLVLVVLLGVVCSGVYALTGSFWAIALIHWVVVVVWLLALGGDARLREKHG
ncbi:MAG: type II CAAX prenyl endopeptidase Rce1 family protein [Leptolyngbyaceae cyanobacterium]